MNGRARLALLVLIAVALTILANVATEQWPLTARGAVLIVAEILGGVALGHTAIAVFSGRDGSWRGVVTIAGGGIGMLIGLVWVPAPLLVRMANGIHGALIGGLIAFVVASFFRGRQRMEDEAEEEKAEELAGHEALVTPVKLPRWNQRFSARVVDTGLLVGAGKLLALAIGTEWFAPATGAEWFVVALLLWPLYDIALHAGLGATAGKALCRMRVVDAGGAERVGVLRAARRWALLFANLPFILIQLAAPGDLVWSIDPRLSVMKPVYCGTILTTAAERRRLAGLAMGVRAEQLADTFRAVRAIPAPMTRRAALVTFVALLVCASFVVWLAIEHPLPD
jgi:hypothetical protein